MKIGDIVKIKRVNKSIDTGEIYKSVKFGVIIGFAYLSKSAFGRGGVSKHQRALVSLEEGCIWYLSSDLEVI